MNKKTFYITTPIYYPSGNLHIGHVYTTTIAWVFKNYKTLVGYDAKFLTGADEHGQKIEQKANENKQDPQKYVDMQVKKFEELWEKLEIDYDYFSRTTNAKHIKAVQKQFSKLLDNDDIYMGEYEGLYSVSDEEFFTPSQAIMRDGEYYSPVSNHKLTKVAEESYFLRIKKYEKWLIDFIDRNKNFIIPNKIVNELKKSFFEKGLEDLSISRSTFKWGIPIKENEKHVIYVWLDALNNYITALGYNGDDDKDFEKYWENGDEVVHLVGKEIARFHCIYWPIILKANNLRLPNTVLTHGWIITPEGKMSKSKGNVVDPNKLIENFGPEVVKYFFTSQMALSSDNIFDEANIREIYNSHLANKFGNLVSRTLAMYSQNFTAPIKHKKPLIADDLQLQEEILKSKEIFCKHFNAFEANKAFSTVIDLADKLNKYIDVMEPWKLKNDLSRLSEVINNLLNGIYALAVYFSVALPKKCEEVFMALNIEKDFNKIDDFSKFDNVKPKQSIILFERMK